jgi:NAD(P)-dependent dehydrogenase (short-subunit alcohol dehydrogenase family)
LNLFDNKVALVTGAGSGIGRATSIMFSQKGARVVAADIDLKEAEQTVQVIKKSGGEAIAVKVDVRSASQVEDMVNTVVDKWGRLDIAFNNAGILVKEWVRLAEESTEVFDNVIDTNLKGTRLCMKHEIRAMLKLGGGVIINNSSISGISPSPLQSSYCASKHAVIGLSNSAAIEYAENNIRIVAVCPGWIDTPLLDPLQSVPENSQLMHSQAPAGRMGRPEEVAELVTWLASDAASYIWGGAFPICGALAL